MKIQQYFKILFLGIALFNNKILYPGDFPPVTTQHDLSQSFAHEERDKPKSYTSLLWDFLKEPVKRILAVFLEDLAKDIEKTLTQPIRKKVTEKLEAGKAVAKEQLKETRQAARRHLYTLQNHYPRTTHTTQQLALAGATFGLTSWVLQSDILPKKHLFPSWITTPTGRSIAGGMMALPMVWKTIKFFLGKKQFVLTQDKEAAKPFRQLLGTAPQPLFLKDLQETFKDKEKFAHFHDETNNAIALYGKSSTEEKKDIVRSLAHNLSIPVFFISSEDLQNSPQNLSDTFTHILNQAQRAQEANSTLCSFICFTDFDKAQKNENFYTLFEKLNEKLFETYRNAWSNPSRTTRPTLPFVIFGISDEEQEEDEASALFSFKIKLSHKENNPQNLLQLSFQKPPSLTKGQKGHLSSFETPKITLEEIPNTYPEEIKLLVWEIQSEHVQEESNSFLFYGPPGTGKTLLAHALAGTLQVPFFNISMLNVLKKQTTGNDYFGAVFRAAREEAIKRNRPSIVFLDECDILLKDLDDIEGENKQLAAISLRKNLNDLDHHIIFIAATNRTTFDKALTRSKRLGTRIYFDLPNEEARIKILEYYLKKRISEDLIDEDTSTSLAHEYAPKTNGFSHADLEELIIKTSRHAKFHQLPLKKIFEEITRTLEEETKKEPGKMTPLDAGIESIKKIFEEIARTSEEKTRKETGKVTPLGAGIESMSDED